MNRTTPLLAIVLLAACGGGEGNLSVTVYGEDFIEERIPAAAGPDDEGFVDGTTVTFSGFWIALSELTVAHRDGRVGAALAEARVFDVQAAGPHMVTELDLEADSWDDFGVTVAPVSAAVGGNVPDEEAATLVDGGFSVRAAGTAQFEGETYAFDWGFRSATRYDQCVDADELAGVVVPTGGRTTAQITVHGDHLFYDELQSETPSLRFAAMAAADVDGDRQITLDELEAVDLTELPLGQYGTGGDGTVRNLRQFVESLTGSLVHFQGEGHCRQRRL